MDDEDQALWDRLVRDLEIPPELREHIANMAEREDETPGAISCSCSGVTQTARSVRATVATETAHACHGRAAPLGA